MEDSAYESTEQGPDMAIALCYTLGLLDQTNTVNLVLHLFPHCTHAKSMYKPGGLVNGLIATNTREG